MWLYEDGSTSPTYRVVAPRYPVLTAAHRLKIQSLRETSGHMFVAPFNYMDNMVKLVGWKMPEAAQLPRSRPQPYSRIELQERYRADFNQIYSYLSRQYHLPELLEKQPKKVHDNVFTDFLPMEEYCLPPAPSDVFPVLYRQHWRHKGMEINIYFVNKIIYVS